MNESIKGMEAKDTEAKVVGVRMEPVDLLALDFLAKARRTNRSAVVRQLVAEEVVRRGESVAMSAPIL